MEGLNLLLQFTKKYILIKTKYNKEMLIQRMQMSETSLKNEQENDSKQTVFRNMVNIWKQLYT